MSTPELPGELRLAGAEAPSPAEAPRGGPPSPGLAPAQARVPGAPSVPDWDPMTLATLVQRVASELFAAPPPSPEPLRPDAAPAVASSVPLSSPPSAEAAGSSMPSAQSRGGVPSMVPPSSGGESVPPAAVAPSGPSSADGGSPLSASRTDGGGSPFTAPLSLGGFDLFALPGFEVPLLDAAPEPLPPPSAQPARSIVAFDSFQLEPTERPAPGATGGALDPHVVRRDFPILDERVHGKRLVWLDNAATTQKPRAVIDRLSYFYEHENSNIHRAAHTLAARATDAYENARDTVARFIGARSAKEIVFVRGTTEGINLVAQSWGRANVGAGDEVLISWLEHHANIVPWQQLCWEKGARLRIAPVDDDGQVIVEQYARLLTPGKTKIVAFSQVSNALGTITPAPEMIALAHNAGAKVLLDGAQSVSHLRTNVAALDCDFFVFSGHKVFAPTGIGVVYGKRDLLEAMPPWQGGGNMIQDVRFEETTFQGPPARFEAGTGNIADAVGLGAALDWLSRLGIENVGAYEHGLLEYATEQLRRVPGLRMIGTAPAKAGVLSFVLAGQKTEEVGKLLDEDGIAVRSGHHCAQPILRRFGVEATVRASLAPYNTTDDLDCLVASLRKLQAQRGRSSSADRRPPAGTFDDPSP